MWYKNSQWNYYSYVQDAYYNNRRKIDLTVIYINIKLIVTLISIQNLSDKRWKG